MSTDEALREQLPAMRHEARRFRLHEAHSAQRAQRLETAIAAIEDLLSSREPSEESGSSAERPDMIVRSGQTTIHVETTGNGRVTGPTPPAISEGVVRILAAEPRRTWSSREVFEALMQRGWLNPDLGYPERGAQAALSRLARNGRIQKVERGRYAALYDGSPAAELQPVTGGDDGVD